MSNKIQTVKSQVEIKLKHTPVPWRYCLEDARNKQGPWMITHPPTEQYSALAVKIHYEPNAAFIVRACNCHDELVEALEQAEAALQDSGDYPHSLESARAALAKAKA